MSKQNENIELLITDMDGTFLNSASTIPDENIAAVKRLKENGVQVIICTGRPMSFIGEYIRISKASPIIIGCNGAIIANTDTREILHYVEMEKETVQSILEFAMKHKLDVCAYTEKGDVFFSETSKRVNVFRKYNDMITKSKSEIQPVPIIELEKNIDRFLGEHVCKFLVTSKEEGDLPFVWEFLNSVNNIYAVSSLSNVIDIMSCGVSKGQGVEKLAEKMKIPLSKVCTVGDNKNDIPMFDVAGISVCMANGDEEAKKHATNVTTKSNDDGGFVEAAEIALNKRTGL